jgi:hypothetical protein
METFKKKMFLGSKVRPVRGADNSAVISRIPHLCGLRGADSLLT